MWASSRVALRLFTSILALAASLSLATGPAHAGPVDDTAGSTGWSLLAITSKVGPRTENARSTSGLSDGIGWWFNAYRSTLSEVRGPVCNFSPSCSRYSQEAIQEYGTFKGLILTGDRLLRCHCCINPMQYRRGSVTEQERSVYADPVSDHASWSLSREH